MALNFPPSPSLNQTYSFGGKTWIWNGYAWNLSTTGAINGLPIGNVSPSTGVFTTLSAIGNITTIANVAGDYILGNGAFLSGVSTSGASSISSGSSNIRIETGGGNIQANVGGTANVWTLATTGQYVTGEISASGNVTANNFIGNANATSLTSGTVPSGRLTGTYSINISGIAATANAVTDAAQPNITSVGTLTALSVSGNAVAANFNTAGLVSATGNIVGGNVSTAGLITATGNVTATANVTGGNLVTGGRVVATGNITSSGNIAGGNVIATTLVSAGGNVTGGNITTGGLITATGNITATANIAGGNLITAGLITATGEITSTANVTGNNLITSGSGGNITGANVVSATSFTAAGNITGGNFITGGLISATGNVTGNYFLGNGACLTGVITSVANINNGNTNVRIDSAGGNIQANVGGTANVFTVTTTGFFVTGVASASGTITGGNLATAGTASATGNVTGGNVITGGLVTATGNITATANVAGGNITTGGLITATGNVTSTANVAGGNIVATNGIVGNTLTVNGDATVAGNLTVSGTTANVNVTNLNIQDPIIGLGRGANNTPLTTNDAKDRGEQLWYYSGTEKSAFVGYKNASGKIIAAVDVTNAAEIITVNNYGTFVVGTLEAAVVSASGNVTGGNLITGGIITAVGNITGSYYFGNGSQLSGILVDGAAYKTLSIVGNVTGASSGNTVLTSNTTVGILKVIAANGIAMVGNATTGSYTIGVLGSTNDGTLWGAGGDCGLVTDAATPPNYDNGLVTDPVTSAYDLGVLTGALPGGPENAIQFNVGLTSFGGTANLIWSGTGANVGGYVSASGNITGSNANITATTAATSRTTGALRVAGGAGVAGDIYAGNSITVDGGAYGNVVTTQFASVYATGSGPNPYSIMQVRSNDGTTGMGMRAYAGLNGQIYSNSGITFTTGATVRDKDFPTGGTSRVTIDSTGVSVTGLITASGNVTGGNVITGGLITATGNITGANLITAGQLFVNSGSNVTAIVNSAANGVGNIGSSSTYFDTVFAKATTAQYADLAEVYSTDQQYAAGTVMIIGGTEEITQSVAEYSTAVVGVISKNPAYLMNSVELGQPLALTGKVRCFVQGQIVKGDLLVTGSMPGHAQACDFSLHRPGCVFGKALENFDGDQGEIWILVGRY